MHSRRRSRCTAGSVRDRMTLASLLGVVILALALAAWLVLLLAALEPLLWLVIRRGVARLGLVRTAATLARLCRGGVAGQRGTRSTGGMGGTPSARIFAGTGGDLGAPGQSPPGECVFLVPPAAPPGQAVTGTVGAMRSARTLGNGRVLGVVE